MLFTNIGQLAKNPYYIELQYGEDVSARRITKCVIVYL